MCLWKGKTHLECMTKTPKVELLDGQKPNITACESQRESLYINIIFRRLLWQSRRKRSRGKPLLGGKRGRGKRHMR